MKVRSPIFCPARRCATWVDIDMLSWPPATTTVESPSIRCCAPSATALSPEPQTWFTVKADDSIGSPARIADCRAGFWP